MAEVLKGQVAFITGAAHGMGEAIAKAYAREGATLGLVDIEAEALNEVVQDIEAMGEKGLGRVGDVRNYDDIQAAVEETEKAFGPIDILVNSAGVGGGNTIDKMTEDEWDRVFDINVKGIFLTCRAVCPGMMEREKGLVINISSLSGLILGMGGGTCYGASKWAVRGFSSYLLRELRPKGIKVCCFYPGSTDSHFRGQPTGRPDFMIPEDIASAALYIAAQRDRVSVHELAIGMVQEPW